MTHVLVVDDSAVDRTLAGKLLESGAHMRVAYAGNGAEALDAMRQRVPDVIVTDLHMPEMDGLELVQAVRQKYPHVPVVLVTAQGSEQLAVHALRHGAANYLSKNRLGVELVDTVNSVLAAAKANRQHDRLLNCLTETRWEFVLDNDASLIPTLVDQARRDVAHLQPCDETALTRLGIALHEALVNAIDHGNLELHSDIREQDDRSYHDIAQHRRRQVPYSERKVYVSFHVTSEEARFVIRDEGPGFDPATLPDPTDPVNLERVFGRGLLLIRTFMDEVRHNPTGNEITMIKRCESA